MKEIRIEKTPELGSLKESVVLAKDVVKEIVDYQRRLMKESTRTFLVNLRKAARVYGMVKKKSEEK